MHTKVARLHDISAKPTQRKLVFKNKFTQKSHHTKSLTHLSLGQLLEGLPRLTVRRAAASVTTSTAAAAGHVVLYEAHLVTRVALSHQDTASDVMQRSARGRKRNMNGGEKKNV